MAIPYSVNNLKTWVSAVCGGTEGDVCYTNVLTSADGTRLYMLKRTEGAEYSPASYILEEYTMTSWDVSTVTLRTSKALSGLEEAYGAHLKSDGTKLFVLGEYSSLSKYIVCYTFATPWDTDTLSFTTANSSALIGEHIFTGLSFSTDGLSFYTGRSKDSANKYIYQQSLSVAWDITSTIANVGEISVADPYGESPLPLQISSDGLRLFALRYSGIMYRYDLSTAFSLASASLTAVLELDTTFTDTRGFYYNSAESKLYVLGFDGSIFVVEYNSAGLSLFWTNFHGQSEVSV